MIGASRRTIHDFQTVAVVQDEGWRRETIVRAAEVLDPQVVDGRLDGNQRSLIRPLRIGAAVNLAHMEVAERDVADLVLPFRNDDRATASFERLLDCRCIVGNSVADRMSPLRVRHSLRCK